MSTKREAIAPNGDKRYVTRNDDGTFKTSVEEHRSLSQDDRKEAKATAKPGHGDKGDGHKGKK